MAQKAWILMEYEEGLNAYGPSSICQPIGVFLDRQKACAAEKLRNAELGHNVDDPDWEPYDVEDEPVYVVEEFDILG